MVQFPTQLSLSVLACLLAVACVSKDNGQADERCGAAGTTEVCYSGAEGTLGVGPCTSGMRTCGDDGFWSACEGEVTPVVGCESEADVNCDGTIAADRDFDGDGFTACGGDCCDTIFDCAEPEKVNPNAIEVATTDGSPSVDENCNGIIDEEPEPCDAALTLTDGDAGNAARAIDLCTGVLQARYTRANGATHSSYKQHGIQSAFGSNMLPRKGANMLSLATGTARTPGQPDACGIANCKHNENGTAPTDFPQDVPNCPGSAQVHDDVALTLRLKAPPNAKGYSFDYAFYTFEYPEWVCDEFNDQFVAIVDPAPPGAINGNIAFDSLTNPVSINIAFFDVCDGCAGGTAPMAGTGFNDWNDAGATSWLRTEAPVEPGSEFTIQLMIWDTGDQDFDSTVIIDNFQWLADPVGVNTNPIE